MRVLSVQEINHVSGSASTNAVSAPNPLSFLLVGLLVVLSGKNFIKWFY